MPAPLGDVSVTILGKLNGEWTDKEALIKSVTPTIPSGRGLRKYQQNHQNGRKFVKGEYQQREWTLEEQIVSGKRALVVSALGTLVESRYLDRKDDDSQGETKVFYKKLREPGQVMERKRFSRHTDIFDQFAADISGQQVDDRLAGLEELTDFLIKMMEELTSGLEGRIAELESQLRLSNTHISGHTGKLSKLKEEINQLNKWRARVIEGVNKT